MMNMTGINRENAVFVGNMKKDEASAEGAGLDYIDVEQIERGWFE